MFNLNKYFRHLTFESNGREGAVIYNELTRDIRFYMEFGGKNVVFILSLPSKNEWEKFGFNLREREEIINYVAENTQKAQAPNSFYEIGDSAIIFYDKTL